MRIKGIVLIALLLASLGIAAPGKTSPASQRAFQKMASLAGDWEGKDEHGMLAKTNFKVVAANTAVMETLAAPGMEEMVTLYSVNGDKLSIIHYCPTNNQPHMEATPPEGEVKDLVFEFKDARNMASPAAGHQSKLALRFDDADHFTEIWTWTQNGKDVLMTFHFARKK